MDRHPPLPLLISLFSRKCCSVGSVQRRFHLGGCGTVLIAHAGLEYLLPCVAQREHAGGRTAISLIGDPLSDYEKCDQPPDRTKVQVQKLIAGSPHLMLESNAFPGRSPLKTMVKKSLPSSNTKTQPNTGKPRDEPQKPSQNGECTAENVVGKPPLPTIENSVNKEAVGQIPTEGPHGGNPPLTPMTGDSRSNPWCLPPPGNQWLVPVMSPSEGLIYKPYMGSWPPAGGFMAPMYGGCGLMTMPPIPAYGVPASHQQPGFGVTSGAPAIAQNYFPTPYGLPVMNSVIPPSPAEQANLSAGPYFHGQNEQDSSLEVNFNMHSRSQCNISNQKSEAFSRRVQKVQASKDTEFAGSTASSPSERPNGVENTVARGQDVLPLFPLASAGTDPCRSQQTHISDQQTRVIKVVPHNRRSATESAARIFRSIQEERQKHESL
ncbi:Protein EARLY FLOWERING [Asimina triloba]